MVGGEELHAGSDLRQGADHHGSDVEDDAVEIQEDAIAERDVLAVIAMERRTHDGAFADMSKQFA